MHRGIGGIGNLNDQLRDALNPTGATQVMGSLLISRRRHEVSFKPRNNYDKDVFNGDMGIIDSVDTINGKVEIDFEGKKVSCQRMEITDLQPAYAISVHKSQGSEVSCGYISYSETTFHDVTKKSCLHWTDSSTKEELFLWAIQQAYAMAIRNDKTLERKTDLIRKNH